MHILISNDDGVYAPGIRALNDALSTISQTIVIAPDRDKSGASNSLSLGVPLRARELDNGFTYYIKRNLKPKNKASIHLILKAGSLMEDDNQLGLAHLIEHMVFNGTKSYPKNEMDKYLNSIGLQIGSDYNASTGFETTTYKIELPTENYSYLEKGIHILSGIIGHANLTDASFEKERKIVEEEWNLTLIRIRRASKLSFQNSKFALRQPIGDMGAIHTL